MQLSPRDVAIYAYKAGFRGHALIVSVAVAGAESTYHTEAHNPVPPDDSWGLWQINMIGKLGPPRRKRFGITSNEQLLDPAVNARAAFIVSGGGASFGAWSTYKNGRYKAHMAEAQQAVASLGSNPQLDNALELIGKNGGPFTDDGFVKDTAKGIPILGSVVDGASTVLDLLKIVVQKMFNLHWWLRVAQFMLGMFLFGMGLYLLFRKQITGAASTAAKAATLA